jgi:hypothetical protein
MTEDQFTIIDDGKATAVRADVSEGRVALSPGELKAALGWELKAEGVCKGPVCVPVPPDAAIVTDDNVDLLGLANLLDRPLALDIAERAAYVGTAASDRAAALASLEAPGFTLPDLQGRLHSLSGYRGQKVLLAAYASW